MSLHINADPGQIAGTVLFPGDPLRAKRIADEVLRDVVQYNTVRGILGFTGVTTIPNFGEVRVSVQGSGMGMPSLSIYANELFNEFDVETIIRVGTCGGLRDDMKPGDLVIAQGACSDSNLNRRRFKGLDFAPLADADLFIAAVLAARARDWKIRAGNILSTDLFYADHDPNEMEDVGGLGRDRGRNGDGGAVHARRPQRVAARCPSSRSATSSPPTRP